jgi:N6-adenosine-specific RNA methylase IME4
MTNKKYQIILADPPWAYRQKQINFQSYDKRRKYFNDVSEHYATMSNEDIKALDVAGIADNDCLLFLWVTSPNLDTGIETGKAWGFDFKTVAFVWDKQRTNYGFYTLSQVELCLVFKKGKIPKKSVTNIKQFLSEKLGKHSVKPNEIRKRIETMFPTQSKIELFARQKTEGWDAIGDGIDGQDIRETLKNMVK